LCAIHELRKTGHLDEVEILSPPLSITPAYIVFSQSPESRTRARQYDEVLAAFKKTSKFKILTSRYLPHVATSE
jgi:polar amino acid transport system substrate-binding protein